MISLLLSFILSIAPEEAIPSDSLAFVPKPAISEKKFINYKDYYFSFPERLLRLCYFRSAVSQEDYLERVINFFCDTFNITSWCTERFDPEISKKTLEVSKWMGAHEDYVATLDGNGMIHTIILQAKTLEERINAHGGAWQKIKIDQKTVLAVLPPDHPSSEWDSFEKNCLLMMGWRKEIILLPTGEQKEAIITCEHADLIEECDSYKLCFIYCHTNSHSFIGDRERAGFYLGMKQNICFFDHRGVGNSKGIPSEVAFYLDIEAVYDQLMKTHPYSAENLWVGGFCAGAPVAAYLKAKLHEQGINFFAEQSFSDLKRDFIETRNLLIRWMGRRALGGLKSPDIPLDLPQRPNEYEFSIERMWANLPYETKGKVVILHTINDKVLPDKVRFQFVKVAQHVNQNVIPIFYYSTNYEDTHADSFYCYPEIQRQFIAAVFQKF